MLDRLVIGARIRSQERHARAESLQAHHRVGHPLVGDVAVGVDDETVPPEAVADRPRLDQAEVDPAGRELLEHLDERPRDLLRQLDDERRLVCPGALGRHDLPRDEHEARHGVGVVADALREHLEVVVVDHAGRRDRRLRGQGSVEQTDRARDVARRDDLRVPGHIASQPLEALRVRDGVRRDVGDVGEGGSARRDEQERHRHEVLADDPQTAGVGERILRARDTALHRVLDRDHGAVAGSVRYVGERLSDVRDGLPDLSRRFRHLCERRLRKGSGWPQVAVGACSVRRVGHVT